MLSVQARGQGIHADIVFAPVDDKLQLSEQTIQAGGGVQQQEDGILQRQAAPADLAVDLDQALGDGLRMLKMMLDAVPHARGRAT